MSADALTGALRSKAAATAARTPLALFAAAAAALVLLPFVFKSGTALTIASLMGITTIFALSFNILLGQTGMLSFGHAVYYGLGAYMTVHAMNAVIAAKLPVPLVLMPLAGAAAGLFFAALFGWVSTKRSGTAFAMISLGLAELVGSSSLILRSFFGGEEGISTDRTKLLSLFGLNFGAQVQVYYLIAFWCAVSALLMYWLTRTPIGRMCNAVRDNADRVSFVGYDPRVVRYFAFCVSGLFAGIAGGLAAVNFELANAALFSASVSGTVLLATFLGGAGHFIGPIIGAVFVTWLQNMLSDLTEVWQLYFGLMFIAVVMIAPGGIAGLIMGHRAVWKNRTIGRLIPAYLLALAPLLLMLAGAVLAIEMAAHLTTKAADGPNMRLAGLTFSSHGWKPWLAAAAMFAAGLAGLRAALPAVSAAWDRALAGQAAARTEGGR